MNNIVKLVLMFAFLHVSSIVNAEVSTYKNAYKKWEKDIKVDGYNVYWKKFIQFNNESRIDETGNGQCYKKSNKKIQLILSVSKDGRINEITSDVEDEKSKCFINIYKGKLAPVPPYSPLNVKLIMS